MKRVSRLPGVGLVTPSASDSWLGGHYIVQSLFLSVAKLPASERLEFHDVWWNEPPHHDAFAEVRDVLGTSRVVRMPRSFPERVLRRLRRPDSRGVGDLFHRAGVDVLFPVPPIDDPGVPFVLLIPDFQYRHLTTVNDPATIERFETYFRQRGASAALVYVTSRAVLRDLETFMPELRPKTRLVFPCTVPTDAWWQQDPVAVASRHALPERFFVVSNQVSAHKNHLVIARALRILRDRGVDAFVVSTGKTADYRDPSFFPRLSSEIEHLGVSDRFRFLGVLPRDEQMAVIRRAIAVLQPSEFEGWGAAVAEAKTLGKPLIASDLPVHREHEHPNVSWVDTYDEGQWADAMQHAWSTLDAGPDLVQESAARTAASASAQRVGREFAAVLIEAADR